MTHSNLQKNAASITRVLGIVITVHALLLTGCGSSSKSSSSSTPTTDTTTTTTTTTNPSTSTGGTTSAHGKVAVNLVNLQLKSAAKYAGQPWSGRARDNHNKEPGLFTGLTANSSTATGITSLKYVFYAMSICTNIVVNGSAYSQDNSATCITLYDAGLGSATVDANNIGTYAAKQIDLMNQTSLTTFNANASGNIVAGSYNYVIVNWSAAISIEGSISVGGTTLSTQPCTLQDSNGLCVTTTAMTAASTGATVVKSANGGTWFKFQNPFVITDSDVTSGTNYTIDMTFNPEGAIAAATSAGPFTSGQPAYGFVSDSTDGSGNQMYVPMIQLSPVPRATTDTTSKETYLLTQTGTGADANAATRVELFYRKSDANKTIYGVNILTLLSNSTSEGIGLIDTGAKVGSTSSADSGAVDLYWTDNQTKSIAGLQRAVSGTVTTTFLGGFTGTATSTYQGTTDL